MATGDLKSTYDILVELAPEWEKMTKSQQVALGTTLAGTNQYKVFSAVMSQMSVAQKAYGEALDSSGTTMRQNAVYMDSLEAKVSLLKSELEQLVIGKGGLQDLGKVLAQTATSLISFVNNIGGLTTIITGLIGVIVTLKGETALTGLFTLLSKFPTLLNNIGVYFLALTTKGADVSLTLKNIGVSATEAQIALGALSAVVTVGVIIFQRYRQAQEDAKKSALDFASAYKSYGDTVSSTLSKIEDENVSKKDLIEINKNLNDSYDEEADKLKDINDLRQEAIDKLYEEAKAKARQTINETGSQYGKQKDFLDSGYAIEGIGNFDTPEQALKEVETRLEKFNKKLQNGEKLTASEQTAMNKLTAEYNSLSNAIEEAKTIVDNYNDAVTTLNQTEDEWLNKTRESQGYIDKEAEALEDLKREYNITEEAIQEYVNAHEGISDEEALYALIEEKNKLEELEEAIDESTQRIQELADAHNIALKDLQAMAKALSMSEEALIKYADASDMTVQNAYDYLSSMQSITTEMDDLANAYSTLQSAVKEYNSTGAYTLETYKALMSLSPEYLKALQEENGQLSINEEMFQQYGQALIDTAKATLIHKTEMKLAQIIADDYKMTMFNVGEQAVLTGATVLQAGQDMKKSGELAKEGAEGWREAWDAMANGINVQQEESKKRIEETEKAFEEEWKKRFDNLGDSFYKYSKNVSRGSSSQKSSIDLVTKAIEKQINALKKEKEVALDAIEAQIKALQKERDARVKAIEKEIKALEKQKKEREKYWEDQLKKLEKENDERERGVELEEKKQKLALAQQQNVMLFKDGQFQYAQDEDAIASAQQDLQETEDKQTYERQKELIEELRDAELEWYEERIEALEEYKEMVEEYYDEQIEQLEEYKEYLSEYYDEQIEKLEETKEQVSEVFASMSEELRQHYATMLSDASTFVDAYNDIIASIGSGMGGVGATGVGEGVISAVKAKFSNLKLGLSTGDNNFGMSHYASGKGSIRDNELAVVGENPKYREIVIGSKLNKDQGVLMNLKRGSGVVNAGATNTLASLFNSLSGAKSNAVERTVNNNGTTISIGNISLPEVKDGNGFVEYLQNFSLDLTQKAYSF